MTGRGPSGAEKAHPVRRRVSRSAEARRAQLLEAGLAAFTRKGVAATTIEDITMEARVAKGTFYLYFLSKDELLVALWDRYIDDFVRSAQHLLDEIGVAPWLELAERLVETLVYYDIQHRDLHRLIFESASSEALTSFRLGSRRVLALLEAGVRQGVEAGAFDTKYPGFAARMLFYGSEELTHDLILHGDDIDPSALVAALKDFIRRVLTTTPTLERS